MQDLHIQLPNLPEFYVRYIKKSQGKPLADALKDAAKETLNIFENISESRYEHAYAEEKWTIRQMLQHMIDAERILSYRALTFAREPGIEIRGFDEDAYAQIAAVSHRSKTELLEELKTLGDTTRAMFNSFNQSMLTTKGYGNQVEFTVEALGYIIAGHQYHHVSILNERYL